MPTLSACAVPPLPGASCWICLEGGADDGNSHLVRNCACRGDAGWSHLACLVAFAKSQTDDMSAGAFANAIEHNVGTPWQRCHTCKKDFQGDLNESLARGWLDAVADLDDAKPQRIAARLNFARAMTEGDAPEAAIDALERLRSDIRGANLRGILETGDPGVDMDLAMVVEFACLGTLLQAHLGLGNHEQVRKYAEEMKSFNEFSGLHSADRIDDFMKIVTSSLEGGNSNSDQVRIYTNMYNRAVDQDGKDSSTAIMAAASLAEVFLEKGNFNESYKWHKEAHGRAKRVFGKDNPSYIEIRRKFLLVHAASGPRHGKLIMKDPKLNGREVEILRSTKDGNKYIVDLGPNGKGSKSQKFKVAPPQLIFAVDTPVQMDFGGGEMCTVFVDSYVEKTNSYKVFATSGVNNSDHFEYFTIPRKDVRVVFSQLSKLGM